MTTTKNSKRRLLLPTALLAGGMAAGAIFSPLGIAGAQTDDETTNDDAPVTDGTDADANAAEGDRAERRAERRADRLEKLSETTGISVDALQSGFDADESLLTIAEANGVSEAELVAALTTAAEARLAEAVENERLTQEEADEKAADLEERIGEQINALPSERPIREGRGGHGHGGRQGAGLAVLEGLGIDQAELREGMAAGQTLAEIAESQGVSQDDLVDALIADATERVDQAVENGRIDADAAAERLAGLEEKITERVTADPADRSARGERGERPAGAPGAEQPAGLNA